MKRMILRILGLALCILPPAITVLEYFPLWLRDAEKAISALALSLLLIAAIPLWRYAKRLLASPSIWSAWLIAWLFLSLFSSLIEGLTAISFMGFVGGVPGAVCLRLARGKEAE